MRVLSKLDKTLIDNHLLDDVLLNKTVLKNRARSVSPDFILEYEDDECVLYLYDLIAYIMLNKKENGEVVDNTIIELIGLSQSSTDEEEIDFISIDKYKYINLIDKLTYGTISQDLMDYLIILYIYNSAKIENEFLLQIGHLDSREYDLRNNALELAILKIKSDILSMKLYVRYETKSINNYAFNNSPKVYKNITYNGKKMRELRNVEIKYIRKDNVKATNVIRVKLKKRKKETGVGKSKTSIK